MTTFLFSWASIFLLRDDSNIRADGFPLHSPFAGFGVFDPLLGTSFEGFQIVEKLGEGGFGSVYLAVQSSTHAERALKFLRFDASLPKTASARFQREIRLMAKLQHPSIVRCFGSLQPTDALVCLIMERLQGETLRDYLAHSLPSWDRLRRWIEQITSALSLIHPQGIVHRDLKPENLFLHRTPLQNGLPPAETPQEIVKILDFGIASIANEHPLTKTGHLFGSPPYMSPEQVQGQAGGKKASPLMDLYSLGIVLYQMLTSRPPFVGGVQSVLFGHLSLPPPPLSEAFSSASWSPEMDAFLQKALAKEPKQRWESAESFFSAFLLALDQQEKLEPSRKTSDLPSPAFASLSLSELSKESRPLLFESPSPLPAGPASNSSGPLAQDASPAFNPATLSSSSPRQASSLPAQKKEDSETISQELSWHFFPLPDNAASPSLSPIPPETPPFQSLPSKRDLGLVPLILPPLSSLPPPRPQLSASPPEAPLSGGSVSRNFLLWGSSLLFLALGAWLLFLQSPAQKQALSPSSRPSATLSDLPPSERPSTSLPDLPPSEQTSTHLLETKKGFDPLSLPSSPQKTGPSKAKIVSPRNASSGKKPSERASPKKRPSSKTPLPRKKKSSLFEMEPDTEQED